MDLLRDFPQADMPTQRRLAVEIRLKLYQSDLAPDVLSDVLTAWWAEEKPAAVRSSALIEDRAGASFAGQFESFLGVSRRRRIPHRAARLLGGAMDHQCAALHGPARARSRRHRDGGAGAAAHCRARIGRRFERNRRRPDAAQRHLGARFDDRPGRSGAGPHRAFPPGFRALERCRPQAPPRSLRAWRRNWHRDWRRHFAASGAGSAGARALPRSRSSHRARPPDAQGRRPAWHAGRDRMGAGRSRLQALAGAAAACRAGPGAGRNLAQTSRLERPSRGHRLGLRPRRGGELRMRTGARRARATSW